MIDFIPSLNSFKPIALNEMDSVNLMNRLDSKYVIPIKSLVDVINKIQSEYRVLSINNTRLFTYDNVYFDTEDYKLYQQHHNGKLTRFKFRVREYCESDQLYFELKLKNNKGKTDKKRIKTNSKNLCAEHLDFLKEYIKLNETYLPSLNVKFKRFTLVNNAKTERITFDTELIYQCSKNSKMYDYFCIIEIKENGRSKSSFLRRVLREMRLNPSSISKYCFGMSNINANNVKTNLLKEKFRSINKLANG